MPKVQKRRQDRKHNRHLVLAMLVVLLLSVALWNYAMMFTYSSHDDTPQQQHPLVSVQKGETPLDCREFLSQVHSNSSYSIGDPNEGRIYSRLTKLDTPPFWVSVHKYEYDKTRFVIFDHGYYYEKALTGAFQQVLGDNATKSNQNARVLDVGGNIGWFTLLSASLGYHVDVFEPNLFNGIRLCQSIHLNGWKSSLREDEIVAGESSINFYNNGVGSQEGELELYLPKEREANPGTGSFIRPRQGYQDAVKVKVMTLDKLAQDKGWFNTQKQHVAILKIDVEGFEAHVLQGAQRLLKSGMVYNIFMEAGKSRNREELVQMYTSIMEAGFFLYKTGSWMGPKNLYHGESKSPKETCDFIIDNLVQNTRASVNLWWKKKEQ